MREAIYMMVYTDNENCWRVQHQDGSERTAGCKLWLEWRVAETSPTLGYSTEEADAAWLFSRWARSAEPNVRLAWTVASDAQIAEAAPFAENSDNFLAFYRWPTQRDTDGRLNWLRLPVVDLLWDSQHGDEWGFIQSATG